MRATLVVVTVAGALAAGAGQGSCTDAEDGQCAAALGEESPPCVDRLGDVCKEKARAGLCETDPSGTWQPCARSCGSCQLLEGSGWPAASRALVAECESKRWIVDKLQAAIDALPDGSPELLAEVVANSTDFREQLWERCPFILRGPVGVLADLDLRSTIKIASEGNLPKSSSNTFMDERVKKGQLHGFRLDYSGDGQKLGAKDLINSMKKSTWVLSKIHSLHPAAGKVTLAYQRAFGWPASSNMYATLPGFTTSAPAHTDRTESFRLQCNGKKHWKIWAPKVLYPVYGVHEDGQWGKGWTELPENQMGPLMLDHTLLPGEVLYMPRGFVHHTATPRREKVGDVEESKAERSKDVMKQASITIALTFPTEQYDLVYEKVMLCVLGAAGLCTKEACELGSRVSIQARRDEELRKAIHMGFLQAQFGAVAGDREAWLKAMTVELKRHFDKIDIDISQAPIDEGVKQIVEVLYDSIVPMAQGELLESTFAPNIETPGGCSNPMCSRRDPVPVDKRMDMHQKATNFLLYPYYSRCKLNDVVARYQEGMRNAGGLTQRI